MSLTNNNGPRTDTTPDINPVRMTTIHSLEIKVIEKVKKKLKWMTVSAKLAAARCILSIQQ